MSKTRKRAHPLTYLKITAAVAIASWLSYAFTRVIDLAYTNHDIWYDTGLIISAVFLLVFSLYTCGPLTGTGGLLDCSAVGRKSGVKVSQR